MSTFESLLEDIIDGRLKITVERAPVAPVAVIRRPASQLCSSGCEDRCCRIGSSFNESIRSFAQCRTMATVDAERFAEGNLRRERFARGVVTANSEDEARGHALHLQFRGGLSYMGFDSKRPWAIAISVCQRPTTVTTFIGFAEPPPSPKNCLGHRNTFNTTASLTGLSVFQQDQRRAARDRMPKRKPNLKIIAALNGESWQDDAYVDMIESQQANEASRNAFLEQLARPVSPRVAVTVAKKIAEEAVPLRVHKHVASANPSQFVRYEEVAVRLFGSITIRGTPSDLSPFFFTRAWACGIDRVWEESLVHHKGFVLARSEVSVNGNLTDVLSTFEGQGSCSLDVIAPDNVGFRHSFTFVSQ